MSALHRLVHRVSLVKVTTGMPEVLASLLKPTDAASAAAVAACEISTPIRQFSSKTKKREHWQHAPKESSDSQRHGKEAGTSSSSSSSTWPEPGRLVLPDTKGLKEKRATAPAIGRVPASSGAAALAARAMLEAAAPVAALAQQPHQSAVVSQQQSPADVAAAAATAAAAAVAGKAAELPTSTSDGPSSSSSSPVAAYPWDVVAALPRSSPYSLERMANMDLSTYISYIRAARHGMPSLFELGVVREQGHRGRAELLRREKLLQAVAVQAAAAASDAPQQHQCQADDQANSSGVGPGCLSVTDEQLQELTQQQLEAAAGAADGATAEEVADCVVDFFVTRRCMQLMLLKRQHRQLLKEKYTSGLAQQQQQQQQQQQLPSPGPEGTLQPVPLNSARLAAEAAAAAAAAEAAEALAAAPALAPAHMSAEIEDVSIWDAFFDADLSDFQQYLAAGAAGASTVFTTINTRLQQQQEQQQKPSGAAASSRHSTLELMPEQLEQVVEARRQLGHASRLLGFLSPGLQARPTFLSGSQLVQLATGAGVDVEDVVQLLDDFYRLKRLGFRECLEELGEEPDAAA